MANRRDRHQAQKAALASLGKGLSRRARSRCELCGDGGSLAVTEVEGGPAEPDEDWALLLCRRCRDLEAQSPETLRFLETAMWSEVPPVQVVAVRSLRLVDAPWAREALDGLWLDEAMQERIG